MAKSGAALPDGSFPIANEKDLANAIHLAGAGNTAKATVKAHIKARAKALGLTAQLPQAWRSAKRRARHESEHRGREVRSSTRCFEIRSAETSDDGLVVLRGMPIVYGVPYEVRDEYGVFQETMQPGAAAGLLASNPDVRFLFDHTGITLARTTNHSLTLRDTPAGVECEARLNPEMPDAKNVIVAVQDGLISQMSVGMVVGTDAWNEGLDKRSISRLSGMPDVSAVSFPASPTTTLEAAKRNLAQHPELRAEALDQALPTARLDHLEAEIRAGKVLSAANAAQLVSMAKTAHDLLASSGEDFAHTPPDSDPTDEGDTDDTADAPDAVVFEDGTEEDSTEMMPDLDTRAAVAELELRRLEIDRELLDLELT
jgi:HK97 family phage prohead protease